MKKLGLDYTFAYCWHVQNNPSPEQAIEAQLQSIRKTQQLGILPQVVTVSQGWSGWRDEGSIWKIPPKEYEALLHQAKDFVGTLPKDQLGGRMLLLDNWNEWGEGHYIAPHREFGFGYLDAVRNVFAPTAGPHRDLVPADIGFGPYDTAYRAQRGTLVFCRDGECGLSQNECTTDVLVRPGVKVAHFDTAWTSVLLFETCCCRVMLSFPSPKPDRCHRKVAS